MQNDATRGSSSARRRSPDLADFSTAGLPNPDKSKGSGVIVEALIQEANLRTAMK
jgi:hypothetical protein